MSLKFIRTLSQLASRVGEDQFERGQFSAHFLKVDLRFRVYVVIDKLGNVRRAQQLWCARLISSEYVKISFCAIFTQNCPLQCSCNSSRLKTHKSALKAPIAVTSNVAIFNVITSQAFY